MTSAQPPRDGELQFADSRKRPVDLLTALSGLFGKPSSETMAKQRHFKGLLLSKCNRIWVRWASAVDRMERMWVNVPPRHKKEALRISATSSTDSTELINKLGNVTPAQIFGKQEPVYLQTRLINHEHRRSTVQSRHHDWIIQITFLQTTNTFIRLHILYLHLYNTHSDTRIIMFLNRRSYQLH